MNNQSKRLLTILLALFMILTSFPLNAFAAQTETNVRNEITDIRTVGDKQVINLGNVRGEKPQLRFFSRGARLFGAPTPQAGSSSETVAQKVEISLATVGLNLEEGQFDPSALTEVGSFDVTIIFKELGGTRTETRTMTFQAGETKKTETFYLPKDFGNGNVEAEIPKLKQTISLRVYNGANSTTNFKLGETMTYTFELTQIIHPVIDLKVVDPYGKELQENIDQELGLKLALEDEHDFNLPANTKTFNIRTLSKFAGDNVADLNAAGDNPTLDLTTTLDANKKLKVGDKTYKLNKITYKALGQEVEINGQKKKVGGYIEFATQPKIIVPTPDDSGDLPKTPDGYKRLSFHAETKANANDGRFENGEKLKVIDVLEGTEFKDKELLAEIAKVKNPISYLNGSPDDKKFLKWNPALPTDKTAEKVKDTDYWAVYLADGGEITPGEKLPDGVFEVQVIKDDTIAADPLYGKSYGVFKGSKLRRDKFPDLEAAKGHQNPKWTTEADAPNTGMVEIKKPWTKVIEKNTTFKATAAKDAATQIGKDGLKAVDTIALQGQELDEKFWHKGVALADNTPADKKDAFAALLKDATVTDITDPARTTAEAGDKVGTLLVTFKDGSTLEVPNQKLIVKPNTVEVSFDNEVGDDAKAPRHKETVVKGKVTSKSGYPVKGAVVEIKDEAGKVIGITQVIDDDGNFTAGTRELKAGEKLTASVTLPDSKLSADSKPKTVKLNADRLKDLLPIAKTQKENFSKKQNAIIKEKLKALDKAITDAEKLVDKNGKAVGADTAENQTAIDNAVKALEKALKELTANIPPSISGPKTHEIFVGEALDLKALVDVTDGDGADDLVVENGSNVKITAVKVEKATEPNVVDKETPVTDLSTINKTVGTYKVTYTAKDNSGVEVTHEMTLTVKPRTTSAIEVTKDPKNMSYLITEKNGKAKLDLTGMTLNLVDNLGKKTEVELTDPKVKLKVNGRDVTNGTELTLDDDVHFIEVEYKDGDKTLTAQTKGVLRVGPDYDNDGTDDRTQNFDPEKIEKLVVIKQPKLDYIAKDKSEADKVFKLNLEGMIVRMTDKAGKEKLALVKEGKFVDYDEPKKEITVLTATPAHGATLTPETATETGDNGKTVEIKSTTGKTTNTEPLKVFYDANGDNTPDHKEGQKTPAPSAMARNVGENPAGTTVEGMATPGAVIKITDKDGNALTTEPTEVKAGPDGKYTATVKPILADGTDIKVTAKLGEMAESDPTPATVFDDKNNNKQPDRDEGFNIEKATDIKFVDQPDLTYLVATKDTEVTFDGKDAKGKAIYLELSYKNGDKTESKIMTLEELMKDTTHISVTPAKGTTDKKENQTHNLVGKAIDVKLVKADKTATSTSKFAIKVDANNNGIADEDETTDTPTVTARNIGPSPTKTTVEGTAPKGSTVTIKYTPEGGQETTKTVTAGQDGKYTAEIEPKLPVDTEVRVTAKDGEKKVSPEVKTQVFEDKDNDGKDDKSQNFDITKADKIAMVYDPAKMNYLVTSEDGTVKLETKGMVVKVTDKAGVEKKFTAEEIAADPTHFTVAPANGADLTIAANNGKPIKVTLNVQGASVTEATTSNLSVKLDANNNGIADEDETTDTPTVTARNIGPSPTKTTVEGTAPKGSTVTIKYTPEGGQETTKTVTAGQDGKYTAEIEPKLPVDTEVRVTAKDGEKKVSPEVKTQVFEDKDNDGKDDKSQNFDITKADKIAMVYDPAKMNYLVTSEDGTVKLETKGMVVKVTDKAGVEKKFTAEEIAADPTHFTVAPANGADLTIAANNGKPIKVTLNVKDATTTEATTSNLSIKLDTNNNGIADEDEKSAKAENVKALNQNIEENGKVTDKPKTTTTVTGKAKSGSTVIIKDDAGKEIGKVEKVGKDGTFTAEVTKQDEGKKVQVIVTEPGKKDSDPTDAIVARDANNDGDDDSKANQKTPTPTAKALNQGADPKVTTITGKAEPGAKVVAKVGDTVVGQATADETTGEYKIEAKKDNAALPENTEVKVTAQVDGKLESDPATTTVKIDKDGNGNADEDEQTERPAALASNKGKNPTFTTIEGKTEKGAVITVTVKVNGEEKPVTVENFVNNDGEYTLEAKYNGKPLENGAEILVYAENAPKKISKPQTTTVFNDVNKDGKPDGGKVDLTNVKDIQVIAPDKMSYTQGEKLVGTGLKAIVRDNGGNIEIFDYDNATGKFKDADGKEVTEITATVANKPIKDLALTEKDHNGKAIDVKVSTIPGSTNQKLEVKQLQTPTPTIEFAANQNTLKSDGTGASETEKKVTTVKFTVKNKPTTVYVRYTVNGKAKEETFDIGAKDDTTKTVDLKVKLPIGADVEVLAKDADKLISDAASAKVVRDSNNDGKDDGKKALGEPVIEDIKAGSKSITVTPPKGATKLVISETDKDGKTPQGSTPITVTKGKDGNWKIGDTPVEKTEDGKLIIPNPEDDKKLKLDEYNVVKVDAEGDQDTTTPSKAVKTVGEAKDTTPPAKPKVDQPVDGDENIKVKTPTEPDAKTITVEVSRPAKPAGPGEEPGEPTVEKIVVTKGEDGNWKTPNGEKVPEVNGKLEIPVEINKPLKTGDDVKVTTTDNDDNNSVPYTEKVVAKIKMDKPEINPIKTGDRTVEGTALTNKGKPDQFAASTVDIHKYQPPTEEGKEGTWTLIAKDVAVDQDTGAYKYNHDQGFKDGDKIRVVAKKPGAEDSFNDITVGVDTSALDKAIEKGTADLAKRNDGTPADKALEKAIQEGEDLKKRDPAPSQGEVNAAKDKIEKAIEEKKNTDKALDELKKAKEDLDEAIKDAKKENKDPKVINEGTNLSDKGKEVIDKNGKIIDEKTGKEKELKSTDIGELIKELIEKADELRKPKIILNVEPFDIGSKIIQFTTLPGLCEITITVINIGDSSRNKTYTAKTEGTGSGYIEIDELKSGDYVEIVASKDNQKKFLDAKIEKYLVE